MSGVENQLCSIYCCVFYDVTSGHISQLIIKWDAISQQRSLCIISDDDCPQQDIYILDDTLRANITLNQSFTDEEIKKAAAAVVFRKLVLENELGLQAWREWSNYLAIKKTKS